MDAHDFESAVTAFRDALGSLLHGDAAAVLARWSTRDDITIANPFGPPQCGRENVVAAIQKGAAQYHSGRRRFEEIGARLDELPGEHVRSIAELVNRLGHPRARLRRDRLQASHDV